MSRGQLALLKRILGAGDRSVAVPVERLRRSFETLLDKFPALDGVDCRRVAAGGVAAEWIDARESRRHDGRAVLYLHGGGFVSGSVASHRQLTARLSRFADAPCLSLDYRRAPEHPYPAALDDAQSAYGWLVEQGWEPCRLAVAGDSAGAGLGALALASLRDRGVPLPASLVCLSPWVDYRGTAPSLDRHAHLDPVVQRPGLERMAHLYLAGADPGDPRTSALVADLRDLPPVLVQAGEAETLLDDALAFGDHARRAGVDVTLEIWPDMIHVWHLYAGRLKSGESALRRAGRFLRRHWPP